MSIKSLGFLGERRAVALLLLGFYTSIFFITGIALGGAWVKCFVALAATYGVAFFGLAAGYFWARWFAMGLGTSGLTMAMLGLMTQGWNTGIAVWGAMHALIYLPLLGHRMADQYENQQGWRQRFNLDDYGVARVKRAVHGAATALPTMIFYTLAPKQDQAAMLGLLLLTSIGVFGLLRMRFWGVLTLAGAGVWALVSAGGNVAAAGCCFSSTHALVGLLAALFIGMAVTPFIGPALRQLRER